MNTKTSMMICLLLGGAITLGSMTYSAFSDHEVSADNFMVVSTHYYNPIPGPIMLDSSIDMVRCNCTTKSQGNFSYNSSNYRFFYNFTGDVQDAGLNHTWLLIAYQNETSFFLIDSGKTDGLQNPDKHVVMNGSIDLNTDLNATMFVIEDNFWNATYMDVTNYSQDNLVRCLRSFERIDYHDTYIY